MVILMLIEVKCHTVPHLEALTHGIDHTSRPERGSTLTLQKTV